MDCKGFKRANKPFYQGPGSMECRELPIKHLCSEKKKKKKKKKINKIKIIRKKKKIKL